MRCWNVSVVAALATGVANVATAPEARGRGLVRALLARDHGITHAILKTRDQANQE